MDKKERIELIRKGNELFNSGEVEQAAKVFVSTNYRDGITRIADHYFYEERQPLKALNYYKMAKCNDKVQEIYDRMFFAMNKMLGKEPEIRVELPPLKVSPKLKILAEEILAREKED